MNIRLPACHIPFSQRWQMNDFGLRARNIDNDFSELMNGIGIIVADVDDIIDKKVALHGIDTGFRIVLYVTKRAGL